MAAGADLGISMRLGLAMSNTQRERDVMKKYIELLKERHERTSIDLSTLSPLVPWT